MSLFCKSLFCRRRLACNKFRYYYCKDSAVECSPSVTNTKFPGSYYLELYARCPKNQLKYLKALQAKHNEYLARIELLPAELPKIDWNDYKSKVFADQLAIIADFEAKYQNFKVPRPKMPDAAEKQLQQEEEQTKDLLHLFKKKSNLKIHKYRQRIDQLQAMLPYTEMSMEEFAEARPDLAPNYIAKSTFWPHDDAENKIEKGSEKSEDVVGKK